MARPGKRDRAYSLTRKKSPGASDQFVEVKQRLPYVLIPVFIAMPTLELFKYMGDSFLFKLLMEYLVTPEQFVVVSAIKPERRQFLSVLF